VGESSEGQTWEAGEHVSREVLRSCIEKTEAGKYKGEGSGKVDVEAGDCEDEKSGWADREGEELEVRGQCLDDSATEEQRN
jgi:hypothetical protein